MTELDVQIRTHTGEVVGSCAGPAADGTCRTPGVDGAPRCAGHSLLLHGQPFDNWVFRVSEQAQTCPLRWWVAPRA